MNIIIKLTLYISFFNIILSLFATKYQIISKSFINIHQRINIKFFKFCVLFNVIIQTITKRIKNHTTKIRLKNLFI